MNMGGPRDHWYTDLFTWELDVFGEPMDALIRDIKRYGGDEQLQDGAALARELDQLSWPTPKAGDSAIADLVERLQIARDRLRQEAINRGWEVI